MDWDGMDNQPRAPPEPARQLDWPPQIALPRQQQNQQQQQQQPRQRAAAANHASVSAAYPTLPRDILSMIRQGSRELLGWYTSLHQIFASHLDQGRWMWHDCFFRHVHWLPDNKAMRVDRQATASMVGVVFVCFLKERKTNNKTKKNLAI